MWTGKMAQLGKGVCYLAWQPELNPQDPPQSRGQNQLCPLTSINALWPSRYPNTHIQIN